MRKIERELRKEFPFAEIEAVRSGGFAVRLPNGKTIRTASTPSCKFWLRHVRGDVRKAMRRIKAR